MTPSERRTAEAVEAGGIAPKIAACGRAPLLARPLTPSTPGPESHPGLGVLDCLGPGRRNGTSVPDLARATGLSNREVRAEIERLVVEERIPIVTLPTARGVFLAATPDEIDLAVAGLRSRSLSMLRRCRALRIAREGMTWSPELFPR